jgi:hypothetical protein
MATDSSTAQPLDPALLVAFRQQAGAVLAQERGLTAAGRVKLAGIARQLGIAEDQIEAAVRSLAESAAPPAPANPAVEKFRRRLRKDLAGKSRTIIGPTIESQIVVAALGKYGLDEQTARQTVADVAAELGLRRISHSQAIDSLAEQIDRTTGDATWLAKEAWDRLRIAGGKWGIELELVDQLIDEKLAANRADRDRQRWLIKSTLYAAGGAVVLAAILIGVVLLARSGPLEPVASPGSGLPTEPGVSSAPAAAQPAWWDVDLTIAVANARKFQAIDPLYPALASPRAAERASAYRRLSELVLSPSPPAGMRTALATVLAGCYALEDDDAAASAVLEGLVALVPAVDAPLPAGRAHYEAAYWAGDTLIKIHHRPGLPAARRSQLAEVVQRHLAIPPAESPDANLDKAARLAVTRRLFAQLTAAAPRQPAQAAALFGYLTDLSADLSDEEFSRLEATYVASALPAAGADWRQYQDAVVRAIASPDPLNALKLLDAYQRVSDPALKQQLAQWLVGRAGVQPKSWEPIDVVSAVRKGLGASGAASTAHDRWQLLRLRAEGALARPLPRAEQHDALLAQTVELAHLTTLAVALAQGDAGNAVFDASIDEPPQLAAPKAAGEEPEPPPARRLPPPVSSRDQRAAERWLTLVGNYERQQQVQRESNIRGLAMQAERFTDLTPQQAAKVAEYVLAEKNEAELAVVLEALGLLRRWKHVRLAVADGLARSPLSPDQRRQVAGALVEESNLPEGGDAGALRVAILESVLGDLDVESHPAAAPQGSGVLDRAGELLADSYRARARLLSVAPAAIAAAESPATSLALSLDPLVSALSPIADEDDAKYLARLPYEANAWGYYCDGDLPRTAAINRALIELTARRVARMRPTQAAAAGQIAAELLAAELSADNVLVQLRHQEAAALKLWILYAPQL